MKQDLCFKFNFPIVMEQSKDASGILKRQVEWINAPSNKYPFAPQVLMDNWCKKNPMAHQDLTINTVGDLRNKRYSPRRAPHDKK